jgi:hypothetical protein
VNLYSIMPYICRLVRTFDWRNPSFCFYSERTSFDNYLQSCILKNPRNIPLYSCNLMSPVYCTIHACLHPIIILTYYLTSIINHYSPFYVLHCADYSYVYFQQLKNKELDFICFLNSKKFIK